jgi:D-amino-acid dehydrogenase
MHVVVVGAGVVGVTTAYYLSVAGYRVTVVDRATEVADGASRGNAGQLSYSFTDALANPKFIAQIPSLIAGRDKGSRVRLAPALLPWGLRFLSQCTSARAKRNTLAVLKTAVRSARLQRELREQVPFDFSHRAAGKLVLVSSYAALEYAKASSALKNQHRCETEVLSFDDALGVEPALANLSEPFVGAVYSKSDEVADSRLFTERMRGWLVESGNVTFKLGAEVERVVRSGNRIKSVRLGEEEIEADATVICAGAWSQRLLQPLGVNLQIYPVRGYSVTLPAGEDAPSVSITSLKHRIVFSRINGSIRVAGFADFKGFSTVDDSRRVDTMINIARSCAPLAADYSAVDRQQWGGFRPMTPDGRPRVGKTALEGLYLNTGHGMLGWTLACATGYDVSQAIKNSHH